MAHHAAFRKHFPIGDRLLRLIVLNAGSRKGDAIGYTTFGACLRRFYNFRFMATDTETGSFFLCQRLTGSLSLFETSTGICSVSRVSAAESEVATWTGRSSIHTGTTQMGQSIPSVPNAIEPWAKPPWKPIWCKWNQSMYVMRTFSAGAVRAMTASRPDGQLLRLH
jgi:hypothetical protein